MADPKLVPLLEVSGSFVRGCLDAARGVLAMADAREYGGIVAAERSAWEMWNELEYLLRGNRAPDDAIKVQINGLLEVLDLVKDLNDVPAGMADRNATALERFEKEYPALVQEVKDQRGNRRFHWSGRSRTSVVAPGDAERIVYKMLSWQTHPDILAIRDVSGTIRQGEADLTFSQPDDVNALVERSASSTSECLLRAWNLFAQFWTLATIDDVPPRQSA